MLGKPQRRHFPPALFLSAFSSALWAQPPESLSVGSRLQQGPTLGGKQFWSDQLVYHDWRIQQNVLTKHHRLIDDRDFRRAAGTFDQCAAIFDGLRRSRELPTMKSRVVIVLHGLGRSRASMQGLAVHLRENVDSTVLNVAYASTRARIGEHAESLAHVIEHLPDTVERIDFVGHSMGNLVVRHYLGDLARASTPSSRHTLHRVRRIVMLAPPNAGASLAERFQKNPVFKLFWGESGREIADWDKLQKRLAIPACEFGILAGGKGNSVGRNPLIEGDDDFVVSVDETRLAGATDFFVVPALHAVIMDSTPAQLATRNFLENGYFISVDARQPIP